MVWSGQLKNLLISAHPDDVAFYHDDRPARSEIISPVLPIRGMHAGVAMAMVKVALVAGSSAYAP